MKEMRSSNASCHFHKAYKELAKKVAAGLGFNYKP